MRRCAFFLVLAVGCGDGSGGGEGGSSTGAAASTSDAGGTRGSSGDASTSGTTEAADDSSSSGSTGGVASAPYEDRGPYAVGLRTRSVTTGDRTVEITFWYPSEDAEGTTALADLVPAAQRDTLAQLMDAAPPECVRTTAEGTLDATLAQGTFPVVLYSHCQSCLGLSSSFIAERLASHGIIVVGVTHTDGSLFDALDGDPAPLDGEFLAVRAADVSAVLDAVSSDGFAASAIDLTRVGMFGHSYGATTTGLVLQDDDRFVAGVAIAAPIENPLLPGVSTAAVAEPMLYLSMQEDNSIQQIGNNLLRNNAMAMPGGSWLVELADAGHWSPSDLCGLVEDFMPGCGEDERQSDGTPFTYLPAETGRSISAAYVTAFFALELQADADAEAWLAGAHPEETVTVTRTVP